MGDSMTCSVCGVTGTRPEIGVRATDGVAFCIDHIPDPGPEIVPCYRCGVLYMPGHRCSTIPVPITTDVNRAFPTSDALGALPKKIPDEYEHQVKWGLFFHLLLFSPAEVRFERVGMLPREGVEALDAWRALEVLLGVRDIKHERKEALWPYLASSWFSDIRWETTKGETITFDDTEFDASWVESQEATT